MSEIEDFEKNLKEIKELGTKLKEPLGENISFFYHDHEKKKILYKGEVLDGKYEGRGILYDKEGYIIYDGYFQNNKYNGFGNMYQRNKLVYEGFFENGEKNGKGILYYNSIKQIYFNGIFEKSNYIKGILYEPNGAKIYEGLFINNRPKEGKSIKLYHLDGELEYDGDFLNGMFHGNGTLYEKGKYEKQGVKSEFKYLKYIGEFKCHKFNGLGKLYLDHYLGKYLFYEGNFDNNIMNGNGKIYYQNKEIFYEGEHSNNDINGKGIKYYKNGNIKIKGIFQNNICLEGIYYSPNGLKLYEGEFKNDIPKVSKNIILYDDNTNKIYEGEINNGNYEGIGIEYCPLKEEKLLFKGNFKNNLYIIPEIECTEFKDPDKKIANGASKIGVISHIDVPGKTCLINRIMGIEFTYNTLATIGSDKADTYYINNNTKYKLIFWDTAGRERFESISFNTVKNMNIIVYLFDLDDDIGVSSSFIDSIKENANNNPKIYVVGNKLDLLNKSEKLDLINKEYFEIFRSVVADSMNKNIVDKYFEISVKTGEGIDKLMNCIYLDSLLYIKDKKEKPIIKYKKKKKDKCNIF